MVSIEVLRRYPYFAGASPLTLRDIAEVSDIREYARGDVLFQQHDPGDCLYVVIEGEIDMVAVFRDTVGDRAVDTLVAGDMFGWAAMVPPYERAFTAQWKKPGKVLVIDAPRVRELCDRDPVLGHRLMAQIAAVLARRLTAALMQLAALS